MGLFSFFRKRKKVEEVKQMSEEDLKWNKMWDLWVKGEVETPYYELMDYLSGVNNGGHHCHLDNTSGNCDLKKYIDSLKKILPEPLKSNAVLAYKTYRQNPDDISDEDVEKELENVFKRLFSALFFAVNFAILRIARFDDLIFAITY